jgi:predicted O-linked N-acetylglucosamine transferase (SPINDLY family)
MTQSDVRQALEHGHALFQTGRLSEAEAVYRQVLQLAPGRPEALHQLGIIALGRNELDAAIDFLREAIAARPDAVSYQRHLGLALVHAGRLEEAVTHQRQAVALDPDAGGAWAELGHSYMALGNLAESIACYREEVARHSGNPEVWSALGLALSETGQIAEAIAATRRAVELEPANPRLHSNLLMLMNFDPAGDVAAIRAEHRAWAERHARPLARQVRAHPNDRTPGRRLRIGYLSPDFRDHVVARSLLPVLEHHDRSRFEVVCYSDTATPDDYTGRVRELADVWRDTTPLADAPLAQQIRQDRIDVLVDLALHLGRPLVLARKPAPVQMTYLGYPAETGLPTVDYRISDVYLDPPTDRPEFGPEQPLRLPRCYWVYRPAVPDIEVGPPPFRRNGHITFGSFNDGRRLHPGVVAAWAQILRELPDSRLLMVVRRGREQDAAFAEQFAAHGIPADRIRLLPRQPTEAYFRLYQEVDISLDPFPYNGGITSLDSLWMGVPFVTIAGDRPTGRTGLSLLTNVGLAEWVAGDAEQYVDFNTRLARALGRLADLRLSLRARLQASPLMDERQFTRDLEALYAGAWERWRAS